MTRHEVDLKVVDLKTRNDDVIFNREMTHRYWLRRRFNPMEIGADSGAGNNAILVNMLNPSKADAYRNDNTITRLMKFAQLWGFGQLWVCNLFAYRSPYPGDLYEAADPIGADNDFYIQMAVRQADEVVVAYGNHGAYMDRATHVLDMIHREGKVPKAFGVTAKGHPLHPLARGKMWIPYETKLRNYESLFAA